jgi:protein-L-isoaspartate(D-aspartate) O-methyltransferase
MDLPPDSKRRPNPGRERGHEHRDDIVRGSPAAGRSGSPEDLVRALHVQGIRDARVIAAFRAVPRARFVPARAAHLAYVDAPIPIPHGQVTTQPSLIARMIQALGLTGTERVLEVGTGLGFQTAILAKLAREVVSVERFADLVEHARANLTAARIPHVTVVVGDGTLGVPEHAPYQAIVVAAASSHIPGPLVEQLVPGGRLVHPVGPGGHELVTAFHKEGRRLVADAQLTPARFVPLIGTHGEPRQEPR